MLLYWIVAILAGASPIRDVWHTAWAALYAAALALSDPPLFEPSSTMFGFSDRPALMRSLILADELVYRLRGRITTIATAAAAPPPHWMLSQSVIARACTQGSLAGAIVLQILRLYDRGWQIQRWPIPIIMGSTYGWIAGLWIGTVWVVYSGGRQQQPIRPLEEKMNN